MNKRIRQATYTKEFDEYYQSLPQKIREKYDVPANLIEIEITESMYITNSSQIMTLMHDLHNDGYSISMDDFGSGYSNLASLSRFAFDTIKLDKSFVDDGKNDKTKLILTFIMDLAHSLNIKVLCEGVETKELVDYLRSIGCILVQGYYFDKPIYYQDFEEKYLKRIIKNNNDVVS
jgi:EAL domain-containing protein (putative c-di-GMP-specific phosphodiesterase class I)